MTTITAKDFALLLIERYRKDRKASECNTNPHSVKIAQITLDSFMNNIAAELRAVGFTLEGIEP